MRQTVLKGLQQGVLVSWTLGKIVFPVTVIVTILQFTPVLDWFIRFVSPLMEFIGLPGEAAMPLVLGNTLNLSAGIGAIVSFDFTVEEVIILALIAALVIHLVWDGWSAEAQYGLIASSQADLTGWGEIIWYGVKIAVIAVIQLSLVIFPLMVAMQFFRDLGWLQSISNVFQPF